MPAHPLTPQRDTQAMISGMAPALDRETWVFCFAREESTARTAAPMALATFREAEGLTLILPQAEAERLGFDTSQPMARITLGVHSALDGVGLTAAVAQALADEAIPCNMVAAYHHDHAFVPKLMAERALSLLEARAHDEAQQS